MIIGYIIVRRGVEFLLLDTISHLPVFSDPKIAQKVIDSSQLAGTHEVATLKVERNNDAHSLDAAHADSSSAHR